MGAGTVRAGEPQTGTVAAAGTVNDLTDPKIIIFDPPVRPCLVRLDVAVIATTAPVLVKINVETDGSVSDDFSTGTKAHYALNDIAKTIDVSEGSKIAVHSVSIVTQDAGDAIDDVAVAGYKP